MPFLMSNFRRSKTKKSIFNQRRKEGGKGPKRHISPFPFFLAAVFLFTPPSRFFRSTWQRKKGKKPATELFFPLSLLLPSASRMVATMDSVPLALSLQFRGMGKKVKEVFGKREEGGGGRGFVSLGGGNDDCAALYFNSLSLPPSIARNP